MSRLLSSDTTILISPALANAFGIVEAAFLQQLHYWLQRDQTTQHQNKRWVYNTVAQWQQQLSCWSEATIERAIRKLQKLGIILIEKLSNHRSDRTNYYTIDHSKLEGIITAECSNDTVKTMEPSQHNEVMEHSKLQQTITANCSDGYTKTNQRLPKNTSKKKTGDFFEKSGKAGAPATPPDSGLCSDQPTTPEPTSDQLDAAPRPVHELWQNLRRCKIDIALDDPRIPQWIARLRSIQLCQRAIDLHATQPSVWHSPDALTSSHDQRRAAA